MNAAAALFGAEEIPRHPRSCESAAFAFDPLHCLAPLEMEGDALNQAPPQGRKSPDAFAALRWLLETRPSVRNRCVAGKSACAQAHRLTETFTMAVVHGAVTDALKLGGIERRPPKLSPEAYPDASQREDHPGPDCRAGRGPVANLYRRSAGYSSCARLSRLFSIIMWAPFSPSTT